MSGNLKDARPIRVLFVGLKYDYGDPRRGLSYEELNFSDTLHRMKNVSALSFPLDEVMRREGRDGMNRLLLRTVEEMRPDITLFLLFTDEIEQKTIEAISKKGGVVTANWFADDHWRFEDFSRYWGPLFDWVITTDRRSVHKYLSIGCQNVILSQWAFNPARYQYAPCEAEYSVTFVGQVHSNRKDVVASLERSGINVNCWGRGWPNGRLTPDRLVSTFLRSKINLNLTESSAALRLKPMIKIFISRRADDTIHLRTPREMKGAFRALLGERRPQIKGRNFEIPGAGGFLMTQYSEGIEDYFVPEKEIVTFESVTELREKLHFYLGHNDEREKIRAAGYLRAVKDHTFEKRFRDIFDTILAVKKAPSPHLQIPPELQMNRMAGAT